MLIFQVTLIVATLLCSLVAGFVFAYAVVIMPGIGILSAGEFLRAFQVTDRVIQDNQPVFLLVWVGSAIALVGAAVVGFGQLDAAGRSILFTAVLVYLLGVQLPTISINVPLNNTVQSIAIDSMSDEEHEEARRAFESRWVYWNGVRTVLASLVSVLLMVLLLRL